VTGPVTAEEVQQAAAKLRKAGVDPLKATRRDIMRACGIGERRARTIKEWLHRSGEPATGETTEETREYNGDTQTISLPKTRICTLEQLIEHCKIDTTEWEVERWVCNKWEMGMKPAATTEWVGSGKRQYPAFVRYEDEPVITPLFQVKAWLRRRTKIIAIRAEIEAMKAEAAEASPVYAPIIRPTVGSGNLLEVNLPDIHMGKLAWGKETGYDDYDVRIAEAIVEEALASLVSRTASLQYDRVAFVVGNDLQHADNKQGTTTKGTQVVTDSRYPKTYTITRRMIVRAAEQLRLIAPVDIIMVPGNHDELSTFCLGDSLECWFRNCEDVTVWNEPTMRKYMEWGRCMLMWTHGNHGKLDDYPLLMATEQPEMWGRTAYREAHTGDKHQRKLIELHGVAVRILPTLCATDDWHSKMLFTGNIRCAEAYCWNKDEGLIGTAVYSVMPKREAA
jgi:hypothetical protein